MTAPAIKSAIKYIQVISKGVNIAANEATIVATRGQALILHATPTSITTSEQIQKTPTYCLKSK